MFPHNYRWGVGWAAEDLPLVYILQLSALSIAKYHETILVGTFCDRLDMLEC